MMSLKRRYLLALLQAEQYDTRRYLTKSGGAVNPDLVKRLRWTLRLKVTSWIAYGLGIVVANVVVGIVVKVGERMVGRWVEREIKRLKRQGMRVIAIAGSYGKTSVKHYVYELLRHKYRTVATPESFNTILGIAKCLYWEVDTRTEVFVVEVGAYHAGDITYLLQIVQPDLGVLTGIARQHLERFGSWEKIQQAKSEIALYMQHVGLPLVANGSDEAVVKNVKKLGVKAAWYRGNGRQQINMDGARCVAKWMGMSEGEIKRVKVREPKSRFEMTAGRYGMRVIDDSFSSNDIGFVEAVKHLGKQTTYTRILVTPGLVELGSESKTIHEGLGKGIIGKADLVILVGKNERTESLARGINSRVKIIWIENTLSFMKVVKELKLKKEPLVLLENDVTENY